MITESERALMVATLVAGFNSHPDLIDLPDDRLVDAAFVQADAIIARITCEREARYQAVQGLSSPTAGGTGTTPAQLYNATEVGP